jgi:hypothetical protein
VYVRQNSTERALNPLEEIKMQVNCSINHTLNQSATNEELDILVSLMERNYFRPNQKEVIAAFVGRQAIKNYLEECEQ